MNIGVLAAPVFLLRVAGVAVPINIQDVPNIIHASEVLAHAVETNQPLDITFKEIAPDLMPIAATVADAFYPGSGLAAQAIIYLLQHSRPMTWDEQQRWFARASLNE